MTEGRIITLLNSMQSMDLSKKPYGYTEKELREALNDAVELIDRQRNSQLNIRGDKMLVSGNKSRV